MVIGYAGQVRSERAWWLALVGSGVCSNVCKGACARAALEAVFFECWSVALVVVLMVVAVGAEFALLATFGLFVVVFQQGGLSSDMARES